MEIGGQPRRIGHDPTGVREENKDDQIGLVPCIEEPPTFFHQSKFASKYCKKKREAANDLQDPHVHRSLLGTGKEKHICFCFLMSFGNVAVSLENLPSQS